MRKILLKLIEHAPSLALILYILVYTAAAIIGMVATYIIGKSVYEWIFK